MQRPEQAIQRAIVGFIRMQYPRAIVFHIPNGGWRSEREAWQLKKIGTTAGVYDLCVLWAAGKVGFLEVKSDKGRLSQSQNEFRENLDACGIPNACVKSVFEAQAALKTWGVV